MTIRGGGNPNSAMAAMPLGEWTRRLGALPAEVLGVDETCMTCPLCGTATQGRVDGGKLCQEFRCDECDYAFGKST